MRHFLRQEKAVFGFRGKIIVHFALIWLFIGLTILATPLKAQTEAVEGNHGHTEFLLALLPVWAQVGIWVVSASIALAFCRTNPSKPADKIAFQALIIPPAVALLSYTWAFFANLVIQHHAYWDYAQGIPVWTFFCSLVLSFSGWPEPSRVVIQEDA